MKKIFTTLFLALAVVSSYAHDVEIDGIFYNLVPKAKEAIVTYRGTSSITYTEYSGSVTIPSSISYNDITYSVSSIGDKAFDSCSGLTSVTIPNSVSSIGVSAFSGCSGLTSVTIPNYVTNIGTYAFYGCSGLTSITIPNSVSSIGVGAFFKCSGLTSVTIPNSVTRILNSTFFKCSGLTSVTIPNSVSSISSSAFSGCSGLTSVTIGNSISSIDIDAFANCNNLETVTCLTENVPRTNTDAFKDSYVSYATLIVPEASLDAYKSTAPWSEFGTFKSVESCEVPETQICATPTITFEDGELVYTTETDGADIVSEVKSADIKKSYDLRVPLTATYNITAYATKAGYDNSEVATATLHWMDGTMDIATGTQEFGAKRAVLVSSNDGFVNVSGLSDGEKVEVYSTDGKLLNTVYAAGNAANIAAKSGETIILKINGETIKVLVK